MVSLAQKFQPGETAYQLATQKLKFGGKVPYKGINRFVNGTPDADEGLGFGFGNWSRRARRE
jgi:hypothetical protein